MDNEMDNKPVPIPEVVPLVGIWESQAQVLTRFVRAESDTFSIGVSLAKARAKTGSVCTTAMLTDKKRGCAGVVFGYSATKQSGLFCSVGGWDSLYVLGAFQLDAGAVSLHRMGSRSNLLANRDYRIQISLQGIEVTLTVDDVEIFSYRLQSPPSGNQVGLYAYGDNAIEFKSLELVQERPRAFIVMPFKEPYDSLWNDVIKKVAEEEDIGFYASRADELTGPVILEDITSSIRTADVVVAEVTPPSPREYNPNVFYEVGYAHALGIPTVLLVERSKLGGSLPFDTSGFRHIFYEDAISGKKKVEENLRKHLRRIKESRGGDD
jgi:hypothetical protein